MEKTQVFAKLKNKNFIQLWAERASLLVIKFASVSFIRFKKYPWSQVNFSIIFQEKARKLKAFCSEEDYQHLENKHAEYILNPENVKFIIKKYSEIEKKAKKFFKDVQTTNFSKISKIKLIGFFKKYINLQLEALGFFRATRPEGEIKLLKKLQCLLLKEHNDKKKVKNVVEVVTKSPEKDMLALEKNDWLKLIENNKNITDAQLLTHALKYPDFFINIYDYNRAINFLRNKLAETKGDWKVFKKEVENNNERFKEIKYKQSEIFDNINNNEIRTIAKVFQNFGIYRFKIKPIWAGGEFACLPLFQELSKKLDIKIDKMMYGMLPNEIIDCLRDNKAPDNNTINKRLFFVGYIVVENNKIIIEGKEGKKIASKILGGNKKKTAQLISGVVANSGRTRGSVYIFEADSIEEIKKAADNFQSGQILVTDMTQPNMVLVMKKAGAIITNQGGLTSHAAIMSREFNTPCIVGTKNATDLSKNGDIVEVDAHKGVVKIIKQS